MNLPSWLKSALRPIVPEAAIRGLNRRRRLSYIENLSADWNSSRRTILAVNHCCDQDYRAIRLANRRLNFVEVDANRLFLGSSRYFSAEVESLCAAYDSAPEASRLLYKKECRMLFERLRKRFAFDVILVPNDNFFFIREFIDVGHEENIPTVLMDKEGTITPHSFDEVSARVKALAPFMSDHVLVWSERQKRFWRAMGAPESEITVVGQPRSDLFHLPPTNEVAGFFDKAQPLVTVFTYLDSAYMPRESDGLAHEDWVEMKTATNQETARLAREYPEFNFVIKCHPQQRDIQQLRDRYEGENLCVLGGSSLGNELICRSDLIVAFQTTAVIEALFLNKNVIYTAWDARLKDLRGDLLPFHEAGGIVVADTFERFREVCTRFLSGDRSDFDFSDEDRERKTRFVNRYFYNPDGHVSERLLRELEKFLP